MKSNKGIFNQVKNSIPQQEKENSHEEALDYLQSTLNSFDEKGSESAIVGDLTEEQTKGLKAKGYIVKKIWSKKKQKPPK